MIALLKARLRVRKSDEGIAMVMVISVGAVMMLLAVAAVAMSLGTLKRSAIDEGWNGSLAAAYAGIAEYQSRLTDEPAYVKYGNPASTFSNPLGLTGTSAPVQLPVAAKTNPAFGVGESGTWAVVEETGSRSRYRYEVDNSKYFATGTIRIRATGNVGNETRSIVAELRQKGFIDFLYFTDYEMTDPLLSSDSACDDVRHVWEGRAGCTIQFAAGDTIGGPVHSNDTILICGATRFKGAVTTGRSTGGFAKASGTGCAAAPQFDMGSPQYSPSLSMPATNAQIKKEVRSDLKLSDVPRPGCLYTGPTEINFLSGGKMNVKSPWTKFTNITGDPIAPTAGDNNNAAQCGSITALQSAAGAEVPVPENNVVYVQNIPLSGINSATTNETITSTTPKLCRTPAGTSLQTPSVSGGTKYSRNVVGYPIDQEIPVTAGPEATASYGCRNGDLFVRGELSGGAVTMASENYVYVTGDIKYKNADTDMLGLIGNNAVWVYNPIDSDGDPLLTGTGRRIDAAILSVAHTFLVQNHTKGPTTGRGVLTINGAISQKFRGPVALTSGTGYTKNYVYDTRFRYTAPPKFLSPVTTTYGVNTWIEVRAAFNAKGIYR